MNARPARVATANASEPSHRGGHPAQMVSYLEFDTRYRPIRGMRQSRGSGPGKVRFP